MATMRPVTVRAPATEICWPTVALTAVSNGSTVPGTRSPGIAGDARGERRVLGQRLVDGDGVGVEVEQRPDALHGRAEVAPVGQPQAQRDAGPVVGPATAAGASVATPWPWGRSSARWYHVPSQASTPGTARAARNATRCSASNGSRDGEVELDDAGRPVPGGAGRGPQRRRRRGEHLADGVVELADAAEAGGERDRREVEVGGLDERAGGARPLGAGDGERAGAELVGHEAGEVALAVGQPAGQPADALAVDDAVDDEAHRPGDDVAADVPLRRAGRGVGPAPLAGPEAALLGGRGGRQEVDVAGLGRHGRAAGAAVDAGRGDGGHEAAVEAAVPAEHGPVAAGVVERQHPTILARRRRADERVSDTDDGAGRRCGGQSAATGT